MGKLLLGIAVAAMALGFSASGVSDTPSNPPPERYTVTVTITCGTLSHSTQLTFTVE